MGALGDNRLLPILLWVGNHSGAVLHIWAAVGLYLMHGFWFGIVGFFLPFVASITYLFLCLAKGRFLYLVACIAWLALQRVVGRAMGSLFIEARREEEKESANWYEAKKKRLEK